MILIGENLNIMVKTIGQAMKEKNPKPIQDLAAAEAEAGVDYIDINLGPARKGGEELMEWMVRTVQEVVDLPLYLDTTNVNAIEAGLKAPLPESAEARPPGGGGALAALAFSRLRKARDARAAALGLDPGTVCANSVLRKIARSGAPDVNTLREAGMLEWQIEQTGPALLDAVSRARGT